MPAQPQPPPVVPVPPLPPPAKPLLANLIAGVGIVMSLLGYGFQAAAQNHPEVISGMGGAIDWAQIAGVLITVGGLAMHTTQAKTNNAATEAAIEVTHANAVAAVTAADAAPPTDPVSKQKSALYTAGTAIQQAIAEDDVPLARRLVAALEEAKKS